MNIPPSAVPDAEALIAGPPCPPFSSIGVQMGLRDPRAAVFARVLSWIRHLAKRSLQFYVIENVPGLAHARRSERRGPARGASCASRKPACGASCARRRGKRTRKSALKQVQRRLHGFGFHQEVFYLNTKDFGLPQHRPRIYIIGVRKSCMARPLLSPRGFPRAPLVSMLSKAPNTNPRSLSKKQRQNLKGYLAKFQPQCRDIALRGTFAAFRVDRDPLKTYRQERSDDCVMTLLTKNNSIWLLALGPCSGQRVSRLLLPTERAALQGFDRREFPLHVRDSTLLFVFGNAMSVPTVGAVMHSIAACISAR